MDLQVKPDTAAAIAFLEAVHPDGLWALTAIKPAGGSPNGRVFLPSERAQAVGWIDALQGAAGLYYSVNEIRADFRGAKASKADIVAAHYVHVDIDDMDGLARLKAYRLAPSFIVFSNWMKAPLMTCWPIWASELPQRRRPDWISKRC